MGFLHGLGFHRNVLELPESPGHLGSGLRPQRFHDLYPLDKATHALLAGEPKNGLWHVPSDANTDSKPSLAKLVYARTRTARLQALVDEGAMIIIPDAKCAPGVHREVGEDIIVTPLQEEGAPWQQADTVWYCHPTSV